MPFRLSAVEFDPCYDVIIDQVTDMAYGEQGAPYTGEVVCFYNDAKTLPKIRRTFEDGLPVGRHICYPDINHYSWQTYSKSISYNQGIKISEGFAEDVGGCNDREEDECWHDRSCKEPNVSCRLSCLMNR